jgi:hypothetical protein
MAALSTLTTKTPIYPDIKDNRLLMSAIENTDAPATETDSTDFDAVSAFARLDNDADERKPSKDGTETATDDNEDTPADQQAADADDSDQEDGPEKDGDEDAGDEESAEEGTSVKISDETVIKHKVDGEEREFTVGQLKRLAGQEASLTRRSQEVASKAKQLDTAAEATVGALEALMAHADKQWEPYSKINFLAAAKDPNISAEELEAAQTAARAAWEHREFVQNELKQSVSRLQEKRNADLAEAAKECIKVLGDPEKGIKGWNQEVYTNIISYAKQEGIAAEVLDELVDPAAYKILHKAMLYDKGKTAVKKAADDKSKQKKAPQKIVKNSTSPKTAPQKTGNEAAMKRLRDSGSLDDAAAAWSSLGK